jgi:hypothetical protein
LKKNQEQSEVREQCEANFGRIHTDFFVALKMQMGKLVFMRRQGFDQVSQI